MVSSDDAVKTPTAPAAVPPSDCEETMRALWDYLDGALDSPGMAVIDSHLSRCEQCREHARFERGLIDRIRDLRREHDDAPALRLRVLEAMHAAGLPRTQDRR